jgi:N utilization substance protein A
MQLLSVDKKANIIVNDDQLSIAIGRYGQNVRLAGKLVAWELDIFSAKQWEEHLKQQSEQVEEVVLGAQMEVGGGKGRS